MGSAVDGAGVSGFADASSALALVAMTLPCFDIELSKLVLSESTVIVDLKGIFSAVPIAGLTLPKETR